MTRVFSPIPQLNFNIDGTGLEREDGIRGKKSGRVWEEKWKGVGREVSLERVVADDHNRLQDSQDSFLPTHSTPVRRVRNVLGRKCAGLSYLNGKPQSNKIERIHVIFFPWPVTRTGT